MHCIKATFSRFLSALRKNSGDVVPLCETVLKRGPKTKFNDTEVIALALTADYLEIDSESLLFFKIQSEYKCEFPNIISRRQYHDRRKRISHLLNKARLDFAYKGISDENTFIIDSMPLRVCKIARMYRNKLGKDQESTHPSVGYCAAQKEKYYGYKCHVITSSEGIVVDFNLKKASIHDVKYLNDVSEILSNCTLIGDMGYIGQKIKNCLLEKSNIDLVCPSRKNQKVKSNFSTVHRYKRKRIETVFSQLNDQFDIQKNYAKSYEGYFARILSKITVLTILQCINKANNKSVGKIKYSLY